jgi:MFS family permease
MHVNTQPDEKTRKLEVKIRKSLGYSIMDGAFYSAMVGFGESFFSAFAVLMKATSVQLGLLDAIPKSLGAASQLMSNKFLQWFGSRKRFVSTCALVEGLIYVPIMLAFFLGQLRVYHLILFVTIYWILGAILNPAWSSWMGDLVDERERGAYFGKRNKIAGLTLFASFLAGGFLLQRFAAGTAQYIGFAIIFSLALVARIFSFIYLMKKYEPVYHFQPKVQFSFIDFLKQAPHRNYGMFALYLALMNFSVYLAAPFFTVYMLSTLKFDYMTFTIVSAVAMLVKYLCMPIWGKAADRFGTRKVLSLTGFLMPMSPIMWLFSTNVRYLIVAQVYSGFTWAGFELASFNFIFDTTSAEKRTTCVAYYNVLGGVAIFFGAIIGSLIVNYNNVFWSKYLLIFLISGLMRYVASFVFVPRLKEVRPVEHIPYTRLLFRVGAVGPTQGVIHEIGSFQKNVSELPKTIADVSEAVLVKPLRGTAEFGEKVIVKNIKKTAEASGKALKKNIRKVEDIIPKLNGKRKF